MNKISLQMTMEEFGCSVLNYTENKILTSFFYSEERYKDSLNGVNCIQGNGVYQLDQILELNKIEDDKLVIVQCDGIESAKYKFVTLFKATIEYKQDKLNKSLTFRIRKNVFDNRLNLFDETKNSTDFKSMSKLKNYLEDSFRKYKIIEWNIYFQ